ncbi:SRPBCC family protein [Streptomyces spinosisporus]|jgi:carbon monoxide dehydrogenase subunit G|uniref:SRPBCC family protein n=1 Tax=Streptomyces spinosisporus TaxID=2927582 RepID=A0ABS9XLQ0_9ACTN|nr:SRPBCC family protein [Streptomyces spinosisporus]MCI3242271.1 SRPBCC family protein [Streptomyces spinosisporus]
MELNHEFTVPVPVDDAWRTLLDIERVAPCMPGASVEDYDGKTVTGSVKVKVGPITVTYKGTAVFEEQDETAHRMVLIASGRETRGQGTARATVTGTLTERDGATSVSVRTDLTVTGRPAQFGRGVMAEVGDRLIAQFSDCLAQRIGEPTATDRPAAGSEGTTESEAGAAAAGAGTAGAKETPPETEPLDLLRAAGVPVAKRAAVGTAAALVVAVVALGLRRKRRH